MFVWDVRIVDEHPHVQANGAASDLTPDAAESYEPERFARKLAANVSVACPLTSFHRRVGGCHPSRQRKHQCQRVLSRGDGITTWRIDHDDAALKAKVKEIVQKAIDDGTWQKIYDATLGKSGATATKPTLEKY